MRHTILLTIVIVVLSASPGLADIAPSDVANALPGTLEHPYLFFTAAEKPAILDRIETSPECRDIMARLLAEANRLVFTPVEPYRMEETVDFYSGRLTWLRAKRDAALTLAFVYQMTGDEKYARKSFEFADAVCDLADWVNGYHQFPVIYTRVWPWNVPDDQVSFGVDLEAAHTAQTLAMVYDWLYPALDKSRRDRIRGALLEKLITRVRGNYEYHWWATAYRCNWSSVCNDALGCAALALIEEDPNLVDVVAESYNRIFRTLDEVGPDGGWQEGLGYWNYMLRTSMEFADALKRVTNGRLDLFGHRVFTSSPAAFPLHTYLPPSGSVDFGDSGNARVGQTYFYNKLAEVTGSGETAWLRQNLFGDGAGIFDILWPRSAVEPSLPTQASRHFRGIGWAVMRSDFTDAENVTIACKAGLNDDPHHGHLDCGNFILLWRGERFISELGRGSYDERYFQEERWEFPHAASEGHNVVLVDGVGQEPAKHKDRPWTENTGGEIVEFGSGDDIDYTLMDASGAYPGTGLDTWRRHIVLHKPHITVILDEIAVRGGSAVEIRFHTDVRQDVRERFVYLGGERGDMALIPVALTPFSTVEGTHAFMEARSLTARLGTYRQKPWFGIAPETKNGAAVVATVILPVDSADAADTCRASSRIARDRAGNVTVSFDDGGVRHSYRFKSAGNGLVFDGVSD